MAPHVFDGPGVIPHIEEGFTGCRILPTVTLKPSGEGVADGLTQAEEGVREQQTPRSAPSGIDLAECQE